MSQNFNYSAHISFIHQNGVPVPWHVAFASIIPPFEIITVGLDTERLSLTYEDVERNCAAGEFPRPASTKLDHSAKPYEMKTVLLKVYNEKLHSSGDWDVIVGAVDGLNYWYLKDILPHVILLDSTPTSNDLTLAAAYRKYEADKNWNEE